MPVSGRKSERNIRHRPISSFDSQFPIDSPMENAGLKPIRRLTSVLTVPPNAFKNPAQQFLNAGAGQDGG